MSSWVRTALLAALMLTGCASMPYGQRSDWSDHTVTSGETLWAISQRYGTTVAAISDANDLGSSAQIWPGQELRIPPGNRRPPVGHAAAWTSSDPRGREGDLDFAWPITGRVSSPFGLRRGSHHDGIDLRAPTGTAIHASETGRVIHSDDSLRGYGNMIIIKHAGVFTTVYAHNSENYVSVGDFVEQGEVIGEVGSTGNAEAPHLHFEIRRNNDPRDPARYLP